MSTNGDLKPGLHRAHRLVWLERNEQIKIRDKAKKKKHVEMEEEAEYAVGILERVAEAIMTQARAEG